MSAPQVYRAISAISRELSGRGIAKRHRNEHEDYRYRSIDDVLNRLSPLLAKHKLCVLPRVLERTATDRVGDGEVLLISVALRIAFDLVSTADGSSHTIETCGEALDASDKATAKAMSSAYKHAMLQVFCVPVVQIEDSDAGSLRLKRSHLHQQEPVEGWVTWAAGIIDIVECCATQEALDRLQDRQRPLLKAVSREKPDLYAQLGTAFGKRAAELNGQQFATSTAPEDGEQCTTPKAAKVRIPKSGSVRKLAEQSRANSGGAVTGEARTKSKKHSPEQASITFTEHKSDAEVTEPA